MKESVRMLVKVSLNNFAKASYIRNYTSSFRHLTPRLRRGAINVRSETGQYIACMVDCSNGNKIENVTALCSCSWHVKLLSQAAVQYRQ